MLCVLSLLVLLVFGTVALRSIRMAALSLLVIIGV